MTTIAYRSGVLASDSRATRGEVIDTDKSKKIWRLKDGGLFGTSGNYYAGLRLYNLLVEAVKAAKRSKAPILPNIVLKCTGILIKKKTIYLFERGVWEELNLPYYAIGTGAPYAMVAMDYGADAREAVKAGISKDIYSGGRVQSLEVR